MAFDISKLPKWAIPLGVGGLVGVGVLITRGGNKERPTVPVPVGGQEPGEVDTSVGAMLQAFFDNFGKQQEQTLDNFGDLIAAQNEAMAQRDAAFGDMFREFMESVDDRLDDIELPSNPPNTNPNQPSNPLPPSTPNPVNPNPNPSPQPTRPIPRLPVPPRTHPIPPPRPDHIKEGGQPGFGPKPKGGNEPTNKTSKVIPFVPRNDDDSSLSRKVVSGWH